MGAQANPFKRQWEEVSRDVLAAVERVGASGWYVLGSEVSAFEGELAPRFGARAAVGCASGLDAIEIALTALGVGPGDKVLTTPMSAFATTLAILRASHAYGGIYDALADHIVASLGNLDGYDPLFQGKLQQHLQAAE